MPEEIWCEECQDWFHENQETGEADCNCGRDPYAEDPHKPLNFEE